MGCEALKWVYIRETHRIAKDIYHQAVARLSRKTAGSAGRWIITHDPYPIRLLGFDLDVDLGAERILAAEREADGVLEKLAVEPGRRCDKKLPKPVI